MPPVRWLLALGLVALPACRSASKPAPGSADSGDTLDPGDSSDPDSAGSPRDQDNDGYTEEVDCNDADATVHPGAEERCNDRDDDCDGALDEDAVDAFEVWPDEDGDGFGAATGAARACRVPTGWQRTDTDCDDADATVHPGAEERCDALDHDCDGSPQPEGRLGDFTAASGEVSAVAATGTPEHPQELRLDTDGQLQLCAGTFPVRLELEAAELAISGQGPEATVLDGAGATVVSLRTPAQQVQLQGLTVTGGRGSGSVGGGISTREAWDVALVLENVHVSGNQGTRLGAGILLSGSLQASGLQLSDNALAFDYATATDLEGYFNCEGAGAYVLGDADIEDSDIFGNTVHCQATDGIGAPRVLGGGLAIWGTLELRDSRVYDNLAQATIQLGHNASAAGGGAYVYAGSTILRSELRDNRAEVAGTCLEPTLCHMVAGSGGADIPGDSLLEDSLVTGNTVAVPDPSQTAIGGGLGVGAGGDFVCRCTSPEAQDCGVTGNTALSGGGLWFASGDPPVSTVVSEGCDWTGAQDNAPDDISGVAHHDAGDDADFSCALGGCE